MEEGSMTKVNFHIYYEIDEDEVKTVLRADEYDGDSDGSWGAAGGHRRGVYGRGSWPV